MKTIYLLLTISICLSTLLSAQQKIKTYPIKGLSCPAQNAKLSLKGDGVQYIDNKAEWDEIFPGCRLSIFDWNNFSILVVSGVASGCSSPVVMLEIRSSADSKSWTPELSIQQNGLCRMVFKVQKFYFVQKMPPGYHFVNKESEKPKKAETEVVKPESYFKTDKKSYEVGDTVKVSYYNEQEPILNSNGGGCGGGPYYMVICHNDSTQSFGSIHSCDYLLTTYNYQQSCELNFVASIPGTYSVQFFLGPIGLLNDETRFSRPIYSDKFEVK